MIINFYCILCIFFTVLILNEVVPIWQELGDTDVGDILLECGLFGIYADVYTFAIIILQSNVK